MKFMMNQHTNKFKMIENAHVFQLGIDVESVDEGTAGSDVSVTGQHLKSGRFTGSVDPQQTETFAFSDPQTKAIDCRPSIVVNFPHVPSISQLIETIHYIQIMQLTNRRVRDYV